MRFRFLDASFPSLILLNICCITRSMSTVMPKQCGNSFQGQRVLITGSGRGIGRALALSFYRAGARVALSSRTESELKQTAAIMKESVDTNENGPLIIPADLTQQASVDELIDSVISAWGGLDVLINNAGGAQNSKGPSADLSSDDLKELLDLNVVTVHRVTKAVLNRAMPSNGQIVNISSKAGKVGLPMNSFYVASKFALEGLTASLAAELEDRNIRVNSISPGMVNTKSFPKAPGRKGVRTAESIESGLFALMESDVTGRYLHVDELDLARERGLPDSAAFKPINEGKFDP